MIRCVCITRSDLMEFEIVPVTTSKDTKELLKRAP